MTGLYEQFMSVGTIRRMPGGEENLLKQHTGELQQAFETPPDLSPERLAKLEKIVCESPTGKKTLEDAKKTGVQIRFETGMKCMGLFSPRRNAIILNADRADDNLVSTLVHEARHVWQERIRDITYTTAQVPTTLLMAGFAVEADACTTETLFAHEMKEKRPEIWAAHQKEKYAPVSSAFEKTLNETQDISSAMDSAFQAWYTLPVRDLYAGDFVNYAEKGATSFFSDSSFRQSLTPEELAKKLCMTPDNKCYLKNPAVLTSPEKLHLTPEKKDQLDKAVTTWAKKHNRPLSSVETGAIYIKNTDGSYTPGKKPAPLSAAQLKKTVQNKTER